MPGVSLDSPRFRIKSKMKSTNESLDDEGEEELPILTVPLVFGTYRIKGEVLRDSLCQALQYFRQQGRPLLIDGATKYGNIDVVLKAMKK